MKKRIQNQKSFFFSYAFLNPIKFFKRLATNTEPAALAKKIAIMKISNGRTSVKQLKDKWQVDKFKKNGQLYALIDEQIKENNLYRIYHTYI